MPAPHYHTRDPRQLSLPLRPYPLSQRLQSWQERIIRDLQRECCGTRIGRITATQDERAQARRRLADVPPFRIEYRPRDDTYHVDIESQGGGGSGGVADAITVHDLRRAMTYLAQGDDRMNYRALSRHERRPLPLNSAERTAMIARLPEYARPSPERAKHELVRVAQLVERHTRGERMTARYRMAFYPPVSLSDYMRMNAPQHEQRMDMVEMSRVEALRVLATTWR